MKVETKLENLLNFHCAVSEHQELSQTWKRKWESWQINQFHHKYRNYSCLTWKLLSQSNDTWMLSEVGRDGFLKHFRLSRFKNAMLFAVHC